METERCKDAIKLSGIKRAKPDNSMSHDCSLFMNRGSSNTSLVYVRRKYETQRGKSRTSDNEQTTEDSQSARLEYMGVITNTKQQQSPEREPMITGFSTSTHLSMACATPLYDASLTPISLVKQDNDISPRVNSLSLGATNFQGIDDLHWRVRFTQLHAYLESCDHSNQEAYNNLLRSSSSIERSRQAVELEKRAIRLVVEEGREMERVKALNVLAKSKFEQ